MAASYVARAADGRVVRILEDLVTRDGGLPQQVRSAAKAAALAAPAPASRLSAHNAALATTARHVISFVPAALGDADLEFVVDLGQLQGRTIELGYYSSDVPVQDALF